MTQETKEKISAAQLGKKKPWLKGKKRAFKKRPATSKSQMGKPGRTKGMKKPATSKSQMGNSKAKYEGKPKSAITKQKANRAEGQKNKKASDPDRMAYLRKELTALGALPATKRSTKQLETLLKHARAQQST